MIMSNTNNNHVSRALRLGCLARHAALLANLNHSLQVAIDFSLGTVPEISSLRLMLSGDFATPEDVSAYRDVWMARGRREVRRLMRRVEQVKSMVNPHSVCPVTQP